MAEYKRDKDKDYSSYIIGGPSRSNSLDSLISSMYKDNV